MRNYKPRRRCACGGGRGRVCETCGRFVCPACRTGTKLYPECHPCANERKEWDEKLQANKSFMRWHGSRVDHPYSPVEERTYPGSTERKVARDKERMGQHV